MGSGKLQGKMKKKKKKSRRGKENKIRVKFDGVFINLSIFITFRLTKHYKNDDSRVCVTLGLGKDDRAW